MKKLCIGILAFLSFSPLFAQQTEKSIVVRSSSGVEAAADLPEGMLSETDSLYLDWISKNYINLGENCTATSTNPEVSDSIYMDRLQRIPAIIEMPYNEVVRKFIDMYATRLRQKVAFMLSANNFYMPIFEEALDLYDLPLELKYLPVIESALNPMATSRQGAVGLWQFMLATGKIYLRPGGEDRLLHRAPRTGPTDHRPCERLRTTILRQSPGTVHFAAGHEKIFRKNRTAFSDEPMTTTQHTGRLGEETAARWLLDHGFTLLHRNWRQGHYELDIVAARKGTLHFIEVKTRRRDGLTPPEQALDSHKRRALVRAANAYLTENPFAGEVQFDLIAVETAPAGTPEVRYIEDAIELHW